MLKREITYTDFDENEVTDTYYFNLTRTEIVELEVKYVGGLEGMIKRIIETKDQQKLIEEFKNLILITYGEKSEDGKRFIKTEELTKNFTQTNAYDELFMELAQDSDKAVAFFHGILPEQLAKAVEEQETKTKAFSPPPPPNA